MKNERSIVYIVEHANQIFLNLLFPEGLCCPHCSYKDISRTKDGRYYCKDCHKVFSLKSGTVLHNSNLPISYWLVALYLLLTTKTGISSCTIARVLGTTQKTAWYLLTKVRLVLNLDDVVLSDEIAIDEFYQGASFGRMSLAKRKELIARFKLPPHPKNTKERTAVAHNVNARYKQPIFGMNDCHSIILQALPNPVHHLDVIDTFTKHSMESGSAVADCSSLYEDWKLYTGYDLATNNHSKGQFKAENGSSSNRIEGTFSHLKRTLVCNYVRPSKRLIQLYLNEFCSRFNCRDLDIYDRLGFVIQKGKRIVSRDEIRQYNSLNGFEIRIPNYFDPYEFFRKNGAVVNEIRRDCLVYRREDFILCYIFFAIS